MCTPKRRRTPPRARCHGMGDPPAPARNGANRFLEERATVLSFLISSCGANIVTILFHHLAFAADRLDGVRRVFFLEPFPSYLAALVTPHGLHLPYTHRSTGAAGGGGVAYGRPDYGHLELSFSGVFTLIIYGRKDARQTKKHTFSILLPCVVPGQFCGR